MSEAGMSEQKVQASGGPVLRVSGLDVDIRLPHSVVHAVQDVSLEVKIGRASCRERV